MKTRRELYAELRNKHGITTSAMFHGDLDEEITDEDYELTIKIMTTVFDDLFDAEEVAE